MVSAMNKPYIRRFCEEFDYPEEAIRAFEDAADYVFRDGTLRVMFEQSLEDYQAGKAIDPWKHYEQMTKYAAKLTDAHYETIDLLFFILHAEHLETRYAERGLPRTMWHDAMNDLRCKAFECNRCKGIWGTFVGSWFPGFFSLGRVALGRLQFQPSFKANGARTADGKDWLEPREPYIEIHIPSSGKLYIEDVKASLEMAKTYYASVFEGMDHMHFGCHSWLLFQKHREWLPPTSGIVQFMNLFSIVPSAEPDYADDLWRIFNIREIKDYGALPEDTLLRRKYKEFLLAGGRQESAFGLIRMAL